MPRRRAAFSPKEKVSEGRMRGKRPWQTQVHRIAGKGSTHNMVRFFSYHIDWRRCLRRLKPFVQPDMRNASTTKCTLLWVTPFREAIARSVRDMLSQRARKIEKACRLT
jgi:hypothetical protein